MGIFGNSIFPNSRDLQEPRRVEIRIVRIEKTQLGGLNYKTHEIPMGKWIFDVSDLGDVTAVPRRVHARAQLCARLIAVSNLHCGFVRDTGELYESLARKQG